MLAEASLCLLAFSENAVGEIGKAYGDIGDEGGDSTGGAIAAEYSWWYHVQATNFQVHQGAVTADVTLTSNADAQVVVRDKCGDDVASVGVDISLAIRDTHVSVQFTATSLTPQELVFTGVGQIEIGQIDVDITSPIIWPVDQVAGWIISKIADNFRTSIDQQIDRKMHFDMIQYYTDSSQNIAIPISTTFFERSSIAQLIDVNFGT